MLKNGFILPIMSNANCESDNLVYIIKCTLCDDYYVGQTCRTAKKRWSEHIRAIKKFFPFRFNTNEIGYHFNLKNHFYKKHLQFYIFKNNLIDESYRRSVETDLINMIQTFNNSIINDKIPKYINTLSFVD